MENKSVNINGSSIQGNIIQGNVAGSVDTQIKAASDNQSSSDSYSNDLRGANIANFANQVSDHARQQANQHIHLPEQKQNLAKAAKEIQDLLKQLETTNPTATELEKIHYINDETSQGFKKRVVGALQAGGEAAIEEFLANPYVNVVKAIVKGWLEAK